MTQRRQKKNQRHARKKRNSRAKRRAASNAETKIEKNARLGR